jgi:hypothetical protein
MAAIVRVYRTYRFIDKDPVIDELRTIVQDENLMRRLGIVSRLSGVSEAALTNWFKGDTKRPQNASVMAVGTALGYERKFVQSRKLNVDAELEFATAWNKKERDRVAKAQAAAPKKRKRAVKRRKAA